MGRSPLPFLPVTHQLWEPGRAAFERWGVAGVGLGAAGVKFLRWLTPDKHDKLRHTMAASMTNGPLPSF